MKLEMFKVQMSPCKRPILGRPYDLTRLDLLCLISGDILCV